MSTAMLSEQRRVSLCSDLKPLIGIKTLGVQNSEKKEVGEKVTRNNLGICFLFPVSITSFPRTSGNWHENSYKQMSKPLVPLSFPPASSTPPTGHSAWGQTSSDSPPVLSGHCLGLLPAVLPFPWSYPSTVHPPSILYSFVFQTQKYEFYFRPWIYLLFFSNLISTQIHSHSSLTRKTNQPPLNQ